MGRKSARETQHGQSRRGASGIALIASCALALACGCGGSSGGAASTLTVNDANFQGATDDDLLSLSEAINLATGRLVFGDLTAAEQSQVHGTPGAGRRDVIRFDSTLGAIQLQRDDTPRESILPPLNDPGDRIEGAGMVIDGTPMGGAPQPTLVETLVLTDLELGPISSAPLLVLRASDTRVSGLVIESVPATAILVQGSGSEGVRRVRVQGNTIRGLGENSAAAGIAAIAGDNTSDQRLADLTIADNTITDTTWGVRLIAGASSGINVSARRNQAENVVISGNRIERSLTGIAAYAAEASAGSQVSDNLLRNVAITDNSILATLDAGIRTSTTHALDSSITSENQIESMRIDGNTIQSPPGLDRLNLGMSHSAGRVFARGTSADDVYSGLSIEHNVVDGYATGLLLAAADAERCGDGCDVTGNLLERVQLSDNVWRNLDTGVIIAAGSATEAAALVRENILRDVTLDGEKILASASGLAIGAGVAVGLPPGGAYLASGITFPGFGLSGQVRGNQIEQLRVRDSHITGDEAVVLSGGMARETEDEVAAATALRVELTRNVIVASGAQLMIIGGRVIASGTVRDCLVDEVSAKSNQNSAGIPAALAILDQVAEAGAPPDSARSNLVGNVIR